MKLVLGEMPFINKTELEEKNLNILTSVKSNKYSIIIGFIMTFLGCICSFVFGYQLYYLPGSTLSNLLMFLVLFVIANFTIVIPHELLHMIWFPREFKGDELVLGYNKGTHSFYTFLQSPNKQWKTLLSLLTPLILLTVIPFIIMFTNGGGFNLIAFAFIVANLVLCSNDIYNFLVIFLKSPSNSKVKIYGDKIFHT